MIGNMSFFIFSAEVDIVFVDLADTCICDDVDFLVVKFLLGVVTNLLVVRVEDVGSRLDNMDRNFFSQNCGELGDQIR